VVQLPQAKRVGPRQVGVAAVDIGQERIQFGFPSTVKSAGSSAFVAGQFKRQVTPEGA
jgi:hypothetical protein